MRWNNEKGEEFQNIYETGIKKITSYAWAYFKIEFDDLSEMETSNTMFYMEQESPLDIIDFIQWLHRRNIKFKLKFRYWDKADLFDNLKAFIYICKLNFEIIKTKWR
jgi:hypothetical protein